MSVIDYECQYHNLLLMKAAGIYFIAKIKGVASLILHSPGITHECIYNLFKPTEISLDTQLVILSNLSDSVWYIE